MLSLQLVYPTLHMNGTSRGELQRQLEEACRAVDVAAERVAEAGPNARDYYPLGSAAFNVARTQHLRRLEALADVRVELQQILEHVLDSKGGWQ